MGHWGDEWDPEVQKREDPKGRITINFKKASSDIDNIVDCTQNVDDKHPKNELVKEWAGIMIGFFIMFLISYRVFVFAAIPFMIFYIVCLVKLKNAWKHFGYKLKVPVLVTILVLAAGLAVALFAQRFYPF